MTVKVTQLNVYQLLQLANDSDDAVSKLKSLYEERPYFKELIEAAVSDQWISIDPKKIDWRDYGYHESMAGMFLLSRPAWQLVNQVLLSDKTSNHTKSLQLKSMLEMLNVLESRVLLCVLNKDIASEFPNLTHEVLSQSLV